MKQQQQEPWQILREKTGTLILYDSMPRSNKIKGRQVNNPTSHHNSIEDNEAN
jgi:hypothetical protein